MEMDSSMELFDYIFPQLEGAKKDQNGYHLDDYFITKEQETWLLIFENGQEEWVLQREETALPVFLSLLERIEPLHKEDKAFQNLRGELLQMASQEEAIQKEKTLFTK